nr:putative DNA glycosylase At3g47830 isoform X1 [Ipomoea batatas]
MPRSLKRKHSPSPPSTPSSLKPPNRTGGAAADETNPFPAFPNPTFEECQAVRDDLLALHGFPQDFLKYRKQRLLLKQNLPDLDQSLSNSEQLNEEGGDDDSCGQESVLDGLVGAILSQNTTEVNARRAFASLKSSFPAWEDVHAAEPKLVETAIKCAGLAPSKTSCIKGILSCLLEKKGKLCLEYLRDLSIEEIKRDLSCYGGVGPKTVACVLMFHLNQDDFPVDTHVFQIARTIGWVPAEANVKKTYLHLNQRIPNELKFDLNCLLYTHGKACRVCSGKGSYKAEADSNQKPPCPLLKYVSSSK